MSNLTNMTIAEALKGLENKDFTAVELTQEHIDSMQAAQHMNAFITETPERALEQAGRVGGLLSARSKRACLPQRERAGEENG